MNTDASGPPKSSVLRDTDNPGPQAPPIPTHKDQPRTRVPLVHQGDPLTSSLPAHTDNPGPQTRPIHSHNNPTRARVPSVQQGDPLTSTLPAHTDENGVLDRIDGTVARVRLGEMTTIEAADAAAGGTVVLIPAGAFEQHGPGMPLATDMIRAEHVVDRVAARLGGRAVIGPAIPVGVSPHHLAFAGTVTLSTSTFAAVVREYVGSLHRHGWRKVLVVTGHGGNNATLTAVGQDLLITHPDLQFAWTPLTPLARAVMPADLSEVHGHGGEAETAQMLHLAPELVHRDRLAKGTTTLDELDPVARLSRRDGHPSLTIRYDRLSANGTLGDPAAATPELGQSIVDEVVARIADYVTEWLAA